MQLREAVASRSWGTRVPLPTTRRKPSASAISPSFPASRRYAGVHDFTFFAIEPVRVRYIAGFGEIHWVSAEDWCGSLPEWRPDEASIIAHMNEDHGDSLRAMCAHFRNDPCNSALMLSLDPLGFHVQTQQGIHYLRFDRSCDTAGNVRSEMVKLSREAAA
jgi:hypothetical protein